MRTFLAGSPVERDDMRPFARGSAQAPSDGVVANIAELLRVMRVIAKTRVPEIALKPQSIPTGQQPLELSYDMR